MVSWNLFICIGVCVCSFLKNVYLAWDLLSKISLKFSSNLETFYFETMFSSSPTSLDSNNTWIRSLNNVAQVTETVMLSALRSGNHFLWVYTFVIETG